VTLAPKSACLQTSLFLLIPFVPGICATRVPNRNHRRCNFSMACLCFLNPPAGRIRQPPNSWRAGTAMLCRWTAMAPSSPCRVAPDRDAVLRLTLRGHHKVQGEAADRDASRANLFHGDDRSQWLTDVPCTSAFATQMSIPASTWSTTAATAGSNSILWWGPAEIRMRSILCSPARIAYALTRRVISRLCSTGSNCASGSLCCTRTRAGRNDP
jgi:hypothetical protein